MGELLQVTSSWRSQMGVMRAKNEDSCFANDSNGLYCVADGIGGAPAGEVASSVAVDLFVSESSRISDHSEPWQVSDLEEMLSRLNSGIIEYSQRDSSLMGMGTTFSGVISESSSRWWIMHAGDSRIYAVSKDDQLVQLTKDQTLAEERIKMGLTPKGGIYGHRTEDILTNYLGSDMFSPVVNAIVPREYELLLLCTDGITKMLNLEDISSIVQSSINDIDELCGRLVKAAGEAGSGDDMTLVAVSINTDEDR